MAAALLWLPLAAACEREAPMPVPAQQIVRVATGLPGASFRPLSAAILKGLQAELPQIAFVAVDTPGSNSNLEYLQAGNADIGLAYSDGAYRAYIEELRHGGGTDAARALAVLHPASVHILVRADAPVRSITDLKGRRIASGAAGTGTAFTSDTLLRFFGVPPAQATLHPLSFEGSVDALLLSRVDAAFVLSSDPVDAIRHATDSGARLIEISGPAVDRLLTDYPFFRRSVIPRLTYPRQVSPVTTVALDTLLVCRRQLDDGVVRSLTAAFFRILPNLAAEFVALRSIDLNRAPAAPLPLHPGAALFYRESELAR